jgi:hypothetical protein
MFKVAIGDVVRFFKAYFIVGLGCWAWRGNGFDYDNALDV